MLDATVLEVAVGVVIALVGLMVLIMWGDQPLVPVIAVGMIVGGLLGAALSLR